MNLYLFIYFFIWYPSACNITVYTDLKKVDQSLDKEPGIKIFFNSFLNIFPVPLLGMESTNTTRLIFLYGETCNNWNYALFT